MVKPEHLEMMHFSSKEMTADKSEAKHFDIPLEHIIDDYPPMIKGAPVAFICDLYSEVDLGESKTIPLIVEIKHQFIDDACISDKERMTIDFDAVARVGKSYALLGEEIDPPKTP